MFKRGALLSCTDQGDAPIATIEEISPSTNEVSTVMQLHKLKNTQFNKIKQETMKERQVLECHRLLSSCRCISYYELPDYNLMRIAGMPWRLQGGNQRIWSWRRDWTVGRISTSPFHHTRSSHCGIFAVEFTENNTCV
jgi:hypothetical protein